MPRPSIVPRVAASLIQRLACGEWPAGTELPDVRTLAAAFHVAKNTMRAALHEADRLKLISVRRRQRAVVLEDGPARAQEHLARTTEGEGSRQLLILTPDHHVFHNDPFYNTLTSELKGAAARHGIESEVVRLSALSQLDTMRKMVRRGPRASVFIGLQSPHMPTLLWHIEERVPIMLFNRRYPGFDVPVVRIDEYQAAVQVVKHLADFGHRNLCLVETAQGTLSSGAPNRSQGWLESLTDRGLVDECSLPVLVGSPATANMPRYSEAFATLMASPRRPTAIVFSGLHLAMDFAKDARLSHLRVPEDLSVIVLEPGGQHVTLPRWPQLTTAQVNLGRAAECCIEMANQLFAGDLRPTCIRVLEKIIPGESVGPAPDLGGDEVEA